MAIRGAKTHNLKDISLNIPRLKLVVLTGLSGSGKSSLAFDTLYAEGQRRYVESLSTYARQFLPLMQRPDVDLIEGLSPAIAIEQKTISHNPRSTVGTMTEIHDYLRLLFARAGTPYCPHHHLPLEITSVAEITDTLLSWPEETKIAILAPYTLKTNDLHSLKDACYDLQTQGFVRARLNKETYELTEIPRLPIIEKLAAGEFQLDVVIDRLKIKKENRTRMAESIETALSIGKEKVTILNLDTDTQTRFSSNYSCPECDFSIGKLDPKLFSFNNHSGACPHCEGMGTLYLFDPEKIVPAPDLSLKSGAIYGWDYRNSVAASTIHSLAKHYHFDPDTPFNQLPESVQNALLYGSDEPINMTHIDSAGKPHTHTEKFEGIIPNLERRYQETQFQGLKDEMDKMRTLSKCPFCHGARLCSDALNVYIGEDKKRIDEISHMSLKDCLSWFNQAHFPSQKAEIAQRLIQEIKNRLYFLNEVGLSYLSLDRATTTISGGEAQRIRLASQIGSHLSGVMYVLDEPSIGLHQHDNLRLIDTLKHLRDLGNTVIVVEHDEDMIRQADYLIDLGPGAGEHGGYIIAQGTPDDIIQNKNSITGQWLSHQRNMPKPKRRKITKNQDWLVLEGCTGHNLKNLTLRIPVGKFVGIAGISGSGKSTLINHTLAPICANVLNHAKNEPLPYKQIYGLEHFDKVIRVDQSPIGRTPRSNPATYTGLFTPIRELFASTPEAKSRGYDSGRFSFNVKGGRCESCQGDGVIKVEMHFMPDMYVLCEACEGKRYNRETLEIRYRGKTISEVLDMTISQAMTYFSAVPAIVRKLQTLVDVGLSYLRLGQSATTLSGGEAQRIKLAFELSKKETGKTLYILDEPTTGLHFEDIAILSDVLQKLVDTGNTVVVIEHNIDLLSQMDWLIDMGPEGGEAGGYILAEGTPDDIKKHPDSVTGPFL
ncbi:excinuclease ABC subunit A [Basilea psittacipulmonis DSM 24701]|uniref:UvrABC system protein A n=1 Tax=Basilea psittacipulmonis DSM 24701 TaxID=1072685 RepID=A0A077DAY2_9BURK|nr:excinuclease ABC subunit A [Basilea psittacipulmonis DSM 24701]